MNARALQIALAQLALGVGLIFTFARPISAQLIQVEAGASDMVPTLGGSISVQGQGYEGYLGAGVLDGAFRLGTYAKTKFGPYQMTAGDQTLSFNLPTDIFGGSQFVTTRGLGAVLPGNEKVFLFAGVNTIGAGTPLFQAFQNQTPLGAIFIDKLVTENLHLYSRNILSQQQTWIQGLDWRPHPWLKADLSAGIGSNKPYFAASLDADRNWYEVKVAYIEAGSGFRRITTPSLFSSEPDRENILATVKPYSSLVITAGHENFLAPQGSLTSPFERASVDQLQASFDVAQFRLGAGLFESHGPVMRSVSDGFTISRSITRSVDASASYYQNLSGPRPRASYLIATVREVISPKLTLLEVINRTQGNPMFLLGGSYTTNRISVDVDYQTLYMPFLPNPLVTGIGVTVHVKLWRGVQINGATFRSPEGKLRYTASGATLLTPSFRPASSDQERSPKMGEYIVRGYVRDERGSPIEGAAIRIGEQTVFSNEAGAFLLRLNKRQQLPLTVAAAEFLNPLHFTISFAPPIVTSAPEDSAQDVLIVLRPVTNGLRSIASADSSITPPVDPVGTRGESATPFPAARARTGGYVVTSDESTMKYLRFIARGYVRDDLDQPVEGAAIRVGGQVIFTNADGEFFIRMKKPATMPLEVVFSEFLNPAAFRIISAPPTIVASPEGIGSAVSIVLGRK